MIATIAASLALASSGTSGPTTFLLWSCTMASGERAKINETKDKFLLAFYFPDRKTLRSTDLVISEGADRLPDLLPSEIEVGQWGDVHWLGKNENAITYRFDTLRIQRQGGFGTSYAKVEFFPRVSPDLILAGDCAVMATSNPKAALDEIRSARLSK